MNVKLSSYDMGVLLVETPYHVMFGLGLAFVTLHCRVILDPSTTM